MGASLCKTRSSRIVPLSGNEDPNEECKAIYASLAPKTFEIPFREKVAEVLSNWKASGKLTEIENSTKNIKADSLQELVKSLKDETFDTNSALSQIELAYKAYCWVAQNIKYDKIFFKTIKPDDVLKTRRAVCHGYTTLFQGIAKEIGLQVNRVDGYARLQDELKWNTENSSGHTWNMVSKSFKAF